MRAFSCSRCDAIVSFEDQTCFTCGADLGYVPGTTRLHTLLPDGTVSIADDDDGGGDGDGDAVARNGDKEVGAAFRTWVRCENAPNGCNWLLLATDDSTRCFSCRLTIERPDPDDTVALGQLALAGYAKRRLLFQLREHGLPLTPFYERDGGLGFRLLSSVSGRPVTTGHENGVVTVDLNEVDHAYRESLRIRLGEPYRTMLGHFRHEIGHYYWQVLVAERNHLERSRGLFGDERVSYPEALDRHYREGAPAGWRQSFISEYATMHPWEDFAETWAHYLHITDTLQTVASYGVQLDGVAGPGLGSAAGSLQSAPPLSPTGYHELTMHEILTLWHPLAHVFNQVNRSMGKVDLYPFVIVSPVREKLAFVHELVGGTAG